MYFFRRGECSFMATKALQDIVVLDLTRVLAGPYCTMMLADYGAKVIKIEIPGRGDDTRAFGPLKNGASMYYANVNRGKKGVTLNLKSDKGKEMFKQMVKKADVVVENYRPGVMDKMGVGYDVLKEVNPRIIYGAVSGFGCYGPDSKRPGYDIIAQATGGLMSITGEPGGHPLRVGNAMGDVLGGMNLTIGILMALHARELTGRGQRVDVALVDSVVSSLEIGIQRFFASGKQPELMGNRYASAYPYDSFKAKDGLFVIGCGNDKLFTLLCNKVFKQPELLTDPRFETNLKRCENHAALKPIVEAWSSQYTIKEAVDMILAAGVPAAPINDLPHVTTDPHIAGAREMFVPLHHPVIGDMKVNGNPIKLMDTKLDISVPAPELGQDNAAVYGDLLGLDEAALKKLQEEKVI
jgi:crotonobetainyl-CoA:carnitine CoA-transferase CaiB-like acyl-CoA transferase